MPKQPKFNYAKTNEGYRVNIPASLSATGKRQRQFFQTRDAAKAECARLRQKWISGNEQGTVLTTTQAHDAAAALELLSEAGHKITLRQVVLDYVAQHDTRANSPTIGQIWIKGVEIRKDYSPKTIEQYRLWFRRMGGECAKADGYKMSYPENCFWAINAADATPDDVVNAIKAVTDRDHQFRTFHTLLNVFVREAVNRREISANFCDAVPVPKKKQGEGGKAEVYTPDETRALLAACRDYKDGYNKQCAELLPAFCLMAFAGVRPDEVQKMDWTHIDFDGDRVELPAEITKKNRDRSIRLQPNLKAWLQQVPEVDRVGRIVKSTATWKRKTARIKKEAKVCGRQKQDALRHSFGSYLLHWEASNPEPGKDIRMLLGADMGHKSLDTYWDHYFNRNVKLADAIAYWSIMPPGMKADHMKPRVEKRQTA